MLLDKKINKTIHFYILLLVAFVMVEKVHGQTTFQKTIGGDGNDEAWCVKPTADNGYVICGSTTGFGAIAKDGLIVKTSENGDVEWTKVFGGDSNQEFYRVEQTNDGGFIATGYTYNAISASSAIDAFIVRLDPNGDLLWEKNYGGNNNDYGWRIKKLSDGNFVHIIFLNGGTLDINPYIEKIDPSGNVIWQKQLDKANHNQYFQGIDEAPNGDIVCVGSATGNGNFGPHPGIWQHGALVTRFDANGNMLSNYQIGGTDNDGFEAVAVSPDGSIYCGGGSWVPGSPTRHNAYFVKVSADLNSHSWVTLAHKENYDQRNYSLFVTNNNQLLAPISYNDEAAGNDAELLLLDEQGNQLWAKAYGGTDADEFTYAAASLDGGYVAVGYTRSYTTGDKDIYLVKMDVNGDVLASGCEPNNVVYSITHPSHPTSNDVFDVGNLTVNSNTNSLSVISSVTSNTGPACLLLCEESISVSSIGAICAGEDVNLIAPSLTDATYSWIGPNGFASTEEEPTISNPSSAELGEYSLTVTQAGCVPITASTVVEDDPVINFCHSEIGCVGEETYFKTWVNNEFNVVTTPNTYTWDYGDGSAPAQGSTNTHIYTQAGGFTVSLTKAAVGTCAEKVYQSEIQVVEDCLNPCAIPPSISIVATEESVCEGESSTLTASGGQTYTWAPATGLDVTTGADVVATPMVTTTYTVTGSTDLGCVNTQTITITVNSLPIITVNSPTICSEETATLTASGGDTYLWSTGATTISIDVNPSLTENYTVIGTNAEGCSAEVVSVVTVNALPIVTVNSPEICVEETATLTASGGDTYLWSTTEATTSINVSPTETTTYNVTGITNGCSATAISTVTTKESPVLIIPAHGPICTGASALLRVSGATTYTWTPVATLNQGSGEMVTSTPPQTTTYTVVGTNDDGCTGSEEITVEINPLCDVECVTTN